MQSITTICLFTIESEDVYFWGRKNKLTKWDIDERVSKIVRDASRVSIIICQTCWRWQKNSALVYMCTQGLSSGGVFLARVGCSHARTMRTWPENDSLGTRSHTTFHRGFREQHFTKWQHNIKRISKLDAKWLSNRLLKLILISWKLIVIPKKIYLTDEPRCHMTSTEPLFVALLSHRRLSGWNKNSDPSCSRASKNTPPELGHGSGVKYSTSYGLCSCPSICYLILPLKESVSCNICKTVG